MIRVYLTELERSKCAEVVKALYAVHGGTLANVRRTYIGIISEYAAIKFFNESMGAKIPVKFRTEYNESGGDGGFDFNSCGMTWDVKYSRTGKVPAERLRRSTADMILVCNKLWPGFDRLSVNIFGCFPRKRALRLLAEGKEAEAYEPLSMARIFRVFQSQFGEHWMPSQKPIREELSHIGDIVRGILPEAVR